MKNDTNLKSASLVSLTVLVALFGIPKQAAAHDVSLCAGTVSKTMPDGTQLTLWGYGEDSGGSCTPTVPGPRITVPVGDTTLNITLTNNLPESTSLMIPGLVSTTAPVATTLHSFTDGAGRERFTSFAPELASGASGTYSFTVRPGTYIYQSASHPAKQVQMGLYGMATKDAADGAYPGVAYDSEVVLFYSEIDPVMSAAIASGSFDVAGKSTFDYAPKYFLVNGMPYDPANPADSDLAAAAKGQRTLIRFLNAGYKTHVPMLQGGSLSLVAEYGNVYPYQRTQYSVLLPPGKTRDAIFVAASDGRYPLYDERLDLTNAAAEQTGGMMNFLVVGGTGGGGGNCDPTTQCPVANAGNAVTAEDTPVNIPVASFASDPDNGLIAGSVTIASGPSHGLLNNNNDGTVIYTPDLNYFGPDSFTYNIQDVDGFISNDGTVSINISAVNDLPVATPDSYVATADSVLNVVAPGVLVNDTDVDGDALTAVLEDPASNGTVILNADGSFSYTPNAGFSGPDSFNYSANDGSGIGNIVTVSINVTATNNAPVAVDDYATVGRNTRNNNVNETAVNVIANDTDANGFADIDPASILIVTSPRKGVVTVNSDGTVIYHPNPGKSGSDAFSYSVADLAGARSNSATVRIDILR